MGNMGEFKGFNWNTSKRIT